MMPIDRIPDWEKRIARQDAFWDREIIDRPVVSIGVWRPNAQYPWPPDKQHASLRDRWLDSEYAAQRQLAGVMNTEYCGDALPCIWPNLGPEVLSAFFGAELEFTAETSWAIPNLHDWAKADALRFSEDNFYYRKLVEMTDTLLEMGRGKFYTGLTDFHPGADAIAAFRDPQQLNLDLLEHPNDVKKLMDYVQETYFRVFDVFYGKLTAVDQACCSWMGIASSKKWYIPSNDFSCMISEAMFEEFFVPGIVEECRHLEASIYHLDGPQALRHLDRLLEIKELNAIQWVFGAGNGRASDWIHVYERCQEAGKGIYIPVENPAELEVIMERLKPEGVWLAVGGVRNRDEADSVLKRVAKWR